MPRKKVAAALPVHLEELISLLEKQTVPNRMGALREVEEKHGIHIELQEALEYDAFAERYGRWIGRLEMGLEDQSLSAALSGRASATTILRGRGLLASGRSRDADRGNGRLVLGREHRGAIEAQRKGW